MLVDNDKLRIWVKEGKMESSASLSILGLILSGPVGFEVSMHFKMSLTSFCVKLTTANAVTSMVIFDR